MLRDRWGDDYFSVHTNLQFGQEVCAEQSLGGHIQDLYTIFLDSAEFRVQGFPRLHGGSCEHHKPQCKEAIATRGPKTDNSTREFHSFEGGGQILQLVLNQADQGTDHHSDSSGKEKGRDLIAQGLPTASGEQGQC